MSADTAIVACRYCRRCYRADRLGQRLFELCSPSATAGISLTRQHPGCPLAMLNRGSMRGDGKEFR
jgi:hypothetical protein